MQNDQLLRQWKQAKQTCKKVIDISVQSNIFKNCTQKQTSQEFMKVYDVVYKLCSNRNNEETRVAMVYKDYKQMLKTALIQMAKQLLHERDIYKLQMLRKIFDAYEDILKRLKHMFQYLNRPFHLKESKIDDLDKTGLVLIVTSLFTDQTLLEYDTIYFNNLAKVRKNQNFIDAGILKDYVQILYRFHVRLIKKQNKKSRTLYTDFQQKYLNDAKQYYLHHYQKLQDISPSEYFVEVSALYDVEINIVEECFGSNSDTFINKVFASQFMEEYRDKLIQSNKGLKYILQNREVQVISIISNLYKKLTNSIDGFKQPFENFVCEQIASVLQEMRGELLIKKKEGMYISFIQKLINKNNELAQILQSSFMKYTEFIGYYKAGAERAVMKNELQVPIEEMLACYIDVKFRVSYENQDIMKQDIRSIKNVFEFLQNKDLFLMKYLQKLAKRLMNLGIQTLQNHENLIYYLKMHSGNKLTQKLQTIIDEYKISLQTDNQFKQIQNINKLPYNIILKIFGQSLWPYQDIIQFKQQQLQKYFVHGLRCIKIFQQEKLKKKTLRISFGDSKIRWMYYFDKQIDNKYTQVYFDTNGIQGILLYYIYMKRPQKVSLQLLTVIYPQLKVNIIRQFLKKMVKISISQVQMQQNMIIKIQNDGQIYYKFNPDMKSKKRIIHYDGPIQDQQQQHNLFQKNQLGRQRQYTIDSNIAKLMKSKKVLGIDKIIQEVTKMIKVFNPTVKDIKASIQRLLIKELLVRDDKERTVIKYKS